MTLWEILNYLKSILQESFLIDIDVRNKYSSKKLIIADHPCFSLFFISFLQHSCIFIFCWVLFFDFFIDFIAEWSCYWYLNQSYHESGNFRLILIKIAFGILWRLINIFILWKLVKNFDGNIKISNFNYYFHFINIFCSNIRYYEHSFFSNQSL